MLALAATFRMMRRCVITPFPDRHAISPLRHCILRHYFIYAIALFRCASASAFIRHIDSFLTYFAFALLLLRHCADTLSDAAAAFDFRQRLLFSHYALFHYCLLFAYFHTIRLSRCIFAIYFLHYIALFTLSYAIDAIAPHFEAVSYFFAIFISFAFRFSFDIAMIFRFRHCHYADISIFAW